MMGNSYIPKDFLTKSVIYFEGEGRQPFEVNLSSSKYNSISTQETKTVFCFQTIIIKCSSAEIK